jgi:succinyl-CoA synthetase beta subunit
VFVKAQVALGDREAAGAVRRAETLDEALELSRQMLSERFGGFSPASVLVEEEVSGTWSGYLGVHVDDDVRARVVTFGRGGGVGFDAADAERLLAFVQPPEAFEIRTALARAGFEAAALVSLTAYIHAITTLAWSWSTYVIETNPFTVTPDGVVALDAKAEVDDYSKSLLPNRQLLSDELIGDRERLALHVQECDHSGTLRYVQIVDEQEPRETRNVGSHAVGGGESMIVMDALGDAGLRATNYCDTSGSPSQEKVAVATELIATQPHISGYFFSSCIANQPLSVTAAGLVDGFRAACWEGPTVLRIAGNQEDIAIDVLTKWGKTVIGPVRVFGRETDEWAAARALAEIINEETE